MAVDIRLKRSAVPGKVPSTSSLELGELALNTNDGKVYLKKQVGAIESIIELASTSGSILSASYAVFASTAGYAANAGSALTATSASYATFASNSNSASYAASSSIAQSATSASYATSASVAQNAISASYVSSSAISGDISRIASGSVTASVSPSGLNVNSSATISGSLTVTDTITATRLIVQYITSSQELITGSLIVSGTLDVLGAANINNLTGSLYGTASWALNAISSSYVLSSSFAANAALLDNTGSLSFVNTGSFNTFSSSITTRVSDLEAFSSSLDTIYATDAQLNAATASLSASIAVLSGSFLTASGSFSTRISDLEAFSSSLDATYATDAQLNAATASLSGSIAYLSSSFLSFSGSYNTGSFKGSFTGSFSGSLHNLQGTPTHIPFFSSSQVLADSAIYQVNNGGGSFSIAINQNAVTTANPEALYVSQLSTSSFNIISGKANLNNYAQLNIFNTNAGINASADVVATANNGDEFTNYIDMGINNENFSGSIGIGNDAYLYSTGRHLHIGNATNNPVMIFAGGTDTEVYRKLQIDPNNFHQLTGSLDISNGLIVHQGITGSLYGTASWALKAISSSYAATSSYVLNAISASYALNSTSASYSINSTSASYANNSDLLDGLDSTVFTLTSSFQSYTASADIRFSTLEAATASLYAFSASILNFTASYNTASFTGSFTGSFLGTASFADYATSASYALNSTSASHAVQANNASTASSADNFTVRGTLTAQTIVAQTITSSTDFVTGSTRFGSIITNTHQFTGSVSISGSLSVSDGVINNLTASWASNAISSSYAATASIATSSSYALNATTASYALNSTSASYALDATTASYALNATSASYSNNSTSASYALNATSASYSNNSTSASYALNATTASYALNSTSASYALNATTASYALNATTASYADTASYALDSDLLDGKDSTTFATTGSNIFKGNQTVTGSLFTSGSNTLIGSTTLTGSLSITGSTIQTGNNTLIGNTQLTGSIGVSGSQTFVGNQTLTGSFLVSGSTTQVGNNTLFGNTVLSGSILISGSFPVGSYSSSVNIYGDTSMTGYLKFNPQSTNVDTTITASYIFVSGSTNDLYFSQNGNGYSNVTRLRWIEGNLYTGLLHGGLITAQTGSTTFNLSSGSGIVVSLNASIAEDPYPTITYVNWGNFVSQSITYLTSSVQSYIGIDSNGAITQQPTAFNNGQYNTIITIGTVLHQNKSTVNASITYPNVAYGYKQRTYDFIKAFGPLKLSGLNIVTSSSLGLEVSSGTAFADGRNYQVDPNNPSYITDPGTTVSKIFRYYQSGSEFVQDTNGGVGYTVIDPANYNPGGSGSLVAVPGTGINREWSIQRVFWYPNSATKGIVVYYGTTTYLNSTDAAANVNYEQFLEVENTKQNAVYLGALILRNNAAFTDSTSYKVLPGGVFRNVGGSGGGGDITSLLLSQLGDVSITSPTSGQALVYNSTALKWENKSFISASISGNAATATSASYAATASYVLNAISSSYALNSTTSSYSLVATSASYALDATTSSYALVATSASYALNSTTASYALTATSASYALNATSASYALDATTASYALNATTASYALNTTSASYALNATSASYALAATTASNALTASSADDFIVRGTLTAQTIVAQTITSSTEYVTGSTQFGSLLTNTHQFTGSVSITGSLSVANGINNLTASNAITASYALNATSASFAQTANTASYVLNAVSASYSFNSTSASYAFNATNALTASYLSGYVSPFPYTGSAQITGSLGVTGSVSISGGTGTIFSANTDTIAFTGSFYQSGSSIITGSLSVTQGITGSLFGTASWAQNATSASYVLNAISASHALTASYVNPLRQTVQITGSTAALSIIGSGSGLFTVDGTLGRIFTIDDTISGSLFSVNTGSLAILEVFSDKKINMSGSVVITGSLNVISSITGSLLGTSSYAITASYALNSGMGGGTIYVLDEGVNQGSASYFDFVGGGVTATVSGGTASLSIPGQIITGSNAILVQATPATTWSFYHNLGEKYPVFTIFDSNDDVIMPLRINAINSATASIYWSSPTSGRAVAANCGISGSLQSASFADSASYAATSSYATTFVIKDTLTLDATLTDYYTVASSIVGANNLFTRPTGSFTSAFFKYTVSNGANARTGEVMTVWNGTTTVYTDTSTTDIGATSPVTCSAAIVGSDVQFNIQTNTSGWKLKSLATFM